MNIFFFTDTKDVENKFHSFFTFTSFFSFYFLHLTIFPEANTFYDHKVNKKMKQETRWDKNSKNEWKVRWSKKIKNIIKSVLDIYRFIDGWIGRIFFFPFLSDNIFSSSLRKQSSLQWNFVDTSLNFDINWRKKNISNKIVYCIFINLCMVTFFFLINIEISNE